MSNIHQYKSSVNGRTAEHNLANDTLTVFEGGMILVELDVPKGATPGVIWGLIEADYDAMHEEAEALIQAAPVPAAAPAAAPKMEISGRYAAEGYRLRGHSGRKSDWVNRYTRKINGKSYEFSRIQWAAGGTTLRAYATGNPTPIHEFQI